jgi:hypothetical protein
MFVKPMVALRPLHYSAEVRAWLAGGAAAAAMVACALCCAPFFQHPCAGAGLNKRYLLIRLLLRRCVVCCAQVSVPTDGVFGCGAHSDYGMLTILATDSVPGLQVNSSAEPSCQHGSVCVQDLAGGSAAVRRAVVTKGCLLNANAAAR